MVINRYTYGLEVRALPLGRWSSEDVVLTATGTSKSTGDNFAGPSAVRHNYQLTPADNHVQKCPGGPNDFGKP